MGSQVSEHTITNQSHGLVTSSKTEVTERQLFDDVTRTHKELVDYIYARYTIVTSIKNVLNNISQGQLFIGS